MFPCYGKAFFRLKDSGLTHSLVAISKPFVGLSESRILLECFQEVIDCLSKSLFSFGSSAVEGPKVERVGLYVRRCSFLNSSLLRGEKTDLQGLCDAICYVALNRQDI